MAESDKSPGVLLARATSPAGPSPGIMIAFLGRRLERTDSALATWARAHNPFFNGPNADLLALIPFALLTGFLYLVAREKLLAPKPRTAEMKT